MPSTIRQAFISGIGDASKVSIITADIPAPGSHEVQVKVIYSGMGGSDIQMRQGTYPMQKKAPLNPGYAFVGRVHQNGTSSSKFPNGALVACLSVYGAHAQLVNVPEKYLVPVPNGVHPQQAVCMVLDWNTAYGMVHRAAKPKPGQRVFIHGLSGAVGFALVTLFRLEGAEVYGTASLHNHDALRKAGVTPFVYSNKDWMKEMNAIGGAHVVCDALGFESYDESWSILAPEGGHLIGYGGNVNLLTDGKPRSQIPYIGKLLMKNLCLTSKSKSTMFYISRDQSTYVPELEALFDLSLQGKITVPIRKVWSLEEYPEAHRQWNKGAGIGSVVIKVSDDV